MTTNQNAALSDAHVQPSALSRPNRTRFRPTVPAQGACPPSSSIPVPRNPRAPCYLIVSVPVMFGWTEHENG